jgi:anti-sigma factor RsiW
MNSLCQKMQDKIIDYIIGALSKEEIEMVEQHVAQCPQCRQYMEALQKQSSTLGQWAEQLQGRMTSQEDKIIAGLEHITLQQSQPVWKIVIHSNLTKLAAAALFILGVGFLAGRLSAPSAGDIEHLRTEFRASLADHERRLLEQTKQDMDAASLAIQNQLRQDLKEFGIKTLTAFRTMTDQRSAELIQLIEQARFRDRQHHCS